MRRLQDPEKIVNEIPFLIGQLKRELHAIRKIRKRIAMLDKQISFKPSSNTKQQTLQFVLAEARQDMITSLDKLEKAKTPLLERKEVLQKHLEIAYQGLDTLQNGSSGKLQKAKQIAGHEAEKIKRLINEVGSAIDSCYRMSRKTVSQTETIEISSGIPLEKESDSMKLSKVTTQTIAILDTERYGATTGHETIIEYPKPALGSLINQRNCSISDKIRMGLGAFSGRGGGNYRITMPKFYHNFSGGKV
ncbi:MAG: hypothetical protein H8E17_11100 [Deltaproteobacteria bacterium]|nr:hypothetical protein [Deltaproteobacteria bacterium]